ncbi:MULTISPECIES: hypothetical protein [Lentzea]|uniref:Uncharacterized protein n=1 Tax=Lentzea sokolovensis TaxID=3095429 RepID=A0ABU4UM57_9PSEU|nr:MULTISPECIES: hypothetical protein [Lentzea]MDX8140578.1 hypothetical protein [Lentzea sp. BCCO 10_0061]
MSVQREAHQSHLVDWLSTQVEIHAAFASTRTWLFTCVEELVLETGYWGVPTELPPGHVRGAAGRCFANASAYATVHCLTYVEGFALSTVGIAYPHAWAVDDAGNVHDSTWPGTRGLAYLGIPFSAAYVEAFDGILGDARLVHDAHLDDYRMLRDGLPDGAVLPLGEPVGAGAAGSSRRGGMS